MTKSILDLQEEAKQDSDIDQNKIDRYSLNLASLTTKWNNLLVTEKLHYESETIKYALLRKQKWEYYQYDHQFKIAKGKEMDIYLESDIDLLKINEQLIVSREKVKLIEATIKNLTTTSFNIKNAIEFLKYQAGGY